MPTFIQIPFALKTLKSRLLAAHSEAVTDSEIVLKRFVASSIRARWYRTGASLRAMDTQSQAGDGKGFAVAFSGMFYDVFGEYGTGKRGAANRPAVVPAGWRYGSVPGMRARYAFHAGLDEAMPEIMQVFRDKMRRWSQGK